MSEFTSSMPWGEEFMSMVQDTGFVYDADALGVPAAALETEIPGFHNVETEIPGFHTLETEIPVFHTFEAEEGELGESESFKDHVKGFAKAWGEMVFELGKGCKDIVAQNYLTEDSYAVRKLRGPVAKVLGRLRYLNEYLPEDRDPFHAWSVIFLVFFLAFAVLNVNNGHDSSVPRVKKVYIHPPSATRILLPDGRHMAYREQGVPRDRARYSLISPHGFLSSRLAGIPGVKESLLEEFGVRLITYDLPGFGESDPHPKRNLNTSALDMVDLANALGVTDKFWVLGFSSGAMHAWAALKYIPRRIAGAAMFAPMVNPYESSMTKEEMSGTWEVWVQRRKLMYNLARRFPSLLRYFYSQTFLSGKHGQIDTWLSLSLGNKDKALTENAEFEEFWHRDVEESIRQFNVQPFIEEAVLLVSSWGFKLADLQVQRKCPGKGIFSWLKFMYSQAECELTGFLGPVHIWQGMDDLVVPSSMTDYVARVLPGANVHRLPDAGHFSYFFFCDECHRQIFSTLFRSPEGPLVSTNQYQSRVDESFSVLS